MAQLKALVASHACAAAVSYPITIGRAASGYDSFRRRLKDSVPANGNTVASIDPVAEE
jgi:hypothetical protein